MSRAAACCLQRVSLPCGRELHPRSKQVTQMWAWHNFGERHAAGSPVQLGVAIDGQDVCPISRRIQLSKSPARQGGCRLWLSQQVPLCSPITRYIESAQETRHMCATEGWRVASAAKQVPIASCQKWAWSRPRFLQNVQAEPANNNSSCPRGTCPTALYKRGSDTKVSDTDLSVICRAESGSLRGNPVRALRT